MHSLRGTLQEKQSEDPSVEFETPVTDRKRSHDENQSPSQARQARGKALMDFEGECRGHVRGDSDAATNNLLQDSALQDGSDAFSFVHLFWLRGLRKKCKHNSLMRFLMLSQRASKKQNALSEEQWAEQTHELINQNSKTKELLEEVR